MKSFARRLTDLELHVATQGRWHRILVDGETEAEARAAYEAQHGAIPDGDGIWFRVLVTPEHMLAAS